MFSMHPLPTITLTVKRLFAKLGKTHKASARRFLTVKKGDGSVVYMHRAAGTNHNTGKKSCNAKSRLRGLRQCQFNPGQYLERLSNK